MKCLNLVVLSFCLIFLIIGCKTTQQINGSKSEKRDNGGWKIGYVEGDESVQAKYKDRTTDTTLWDGLYVRNQEHGDDCNVFLGQNKNGDNIVRIDKYSVVWWKSLLGGTGKILRGVPAAATLGVFQYKAAKEQSDTITSISTGGKNVNKVGAAANGDVNID